NLAMPDNQHGDQGLLARGSLVLELDFSIECHTPARLLHFDDMRDWRRQFTIFLNADFTLSVQVQQGHARSYVRLTEAPGAPTGKAKLVYSWDAPRRLGLLSLELPQVGAIHQAVFRDPIPMPLADAATIVFGHNPVTLDDRVCAMALSDRFEPVGPAPSIAAGALVETAAGLQPIENLKAGDMVQTAGSGMQAIRSVICSELPALGYWAPVRLSAPYLGLSHDITVAQHQRVMISGIEAEYNFGEDAVLIEAHQLTGLSAATVLTGLNTQKYYQILLDNHECIRLSGAWSESLFVGHLARSPEVMATTRLADMALSSVPVHDCFARPVLRDYESQTLLAALSA
ncbi:MAG: Hint domain-containing protein, partial [Paracoccaceae bacterium]